MNNLDESVKSKVNEMRMKYCDGNPDTAERVEQACTEIAQFMQSMYEKRIKTFEKLPKWKRVKNPQPCWSGEIGVNPMTRKFEYENYTINADRLFKLIEKE